MLVKLQYFNPNGTYDSSAVYHSNFEHMHQYHEEVRIFRELGNLPGLLRGTASSKDFTILVTVPDHPHNYPVLIHSFQETIEELEYELKNIIEGCWNDD